MDPHRTKDADMTTLHARIRSLQDGATTAIRLVLVLLLFACGCGQDWRIPPCENESAKTCEVINVDVDGKARTALVSKLGGVDCSQGKLPVILVWHGSRSNGASVRQNVNHDFADLRLEATVAGKALFVYPDGLSHIDCQGFTCWDRSPSGRDLRFFDALLTTLAQRYCVRTERVFSIGHSRGGRFVEVLACYRAARHHALASIAAGGGNVSTCPGRAPIWLSHGTKDKVIPFKDGEKHRDNWAARNGCSTATSSFPLNQCTALVGCPSATPVVWCPTDESDWDGHALPGMMDEAIWSFFRTFLTPP